jgi:hypothetical protein
VQRKKKKKSYLSKTRVEEKWVRTAAPQHVIVEDSTELAAGILVASHVPVTEFLKTYVILVAVAVLSSWICPASTFHSSPFKHHKSSDLSPRHQLSPTCRGCLSWLRAQGSYFVLTWFVELAYVKGHRHRQACFNVVIHKRL